MKEKFYITTAIDYPSSPPHLGHAYEKICADAISRWQRNKARDVFFLTGTDEHGQKIERKAQSLGKTPQNYVNEMSERFKQLCRRLDISNDDFIRTTQERHKRIVEEIIKKIYESGQIYKGSYEGLYCVDCESFYLPKDLVKGNCPVHKRKIEKVKEECFSFRMSRYQEKILDYISNHDDFIYPASRRAEIINRLKEGLRDLCISRSTFDWGIPLPLEKRYVIFVWFDALLNYISALGYPGGNFKRFWPADMHIIGKDILWFHSVVWPAILMAAGLDLPRRIVVHGFINISGEKMSKSRGAVVDPIKLADEYGADAVRYFLLREIEFGEDGNFSVDALKRRYNHDLANDLGNLVYRTLTMVEKHFQGKLPAPRSPLPANPLESKIKALSNKVDRYMEELNFSACLGEIWDLINAGNKYIEDSQPWRLAKEGRAKELTSFIHLLIELLKEVAKNLSPFMPKTAESILRQIGIEKIKKEKPLFPRRT